MKNSRGSRTPQRASARQMDPLAEWERELLGLSQPRIEGNARRFTSTGKIRKSRRAIKRDLYGKKDPK